MKIDLANNILETLPTQKIQELVKLKFFICEIIQIQDLDCIERALLLFCAL